MDANTPRDPAVSSSEHRLADIARYAALWDDQPPPSDATAEPEVPAPAEGEALVERYLEQLESQTEPHARADTLRKIARVFEEELADREQALEAVINALREEPRDKDVARDVERLARATNRFPEVLQTFAGWLRAEADPARQVGLSLLLAKWYGEDHDRPELAQPFFAKIVQVDPNNVEAMRQLARLYRKAGNVQQAGATLQHALDIVVSNVERKQILVDLGELLDADMNDTDRAVTYFKQAVVVDPGHLPALDHLARIHAARGQTKELLEVRELQIPATFDLEQRAAVRLEAARLAEQLGDHARAQRHYRDAAEHDPRSVEAQRGLARACEAQGLWEPRVRALAAIAEHAPESKDRIDALVERANIEDEHFLRPELAAARFEEVLALDPNDMGAYFELERIHRKRKDWTQLVATYERHVAATRERRGKLSLAAEIARVQADEMGDLESAISTWRSIVAVDAEDASAHEALAKLLERRGDAAGALTHLGRAAALAPDDATRAEAMCAVGRATLEKLGDRAAARARYEQALELDPGNVKALAALRAFALEDGDHARAAVLLEREQEAAPGSRHRAKLLVELARLQEEKLGDHASALAAWEAALVAEPDNDDCVAPLVEEYLARRDLARAEPLLERLARKPDAGAAAHQRLGRVAAALGNHEKALKAYRAAFAIDAHDAGTLLGLGDACLKTGNLDEASRFLRAALSHLGDAPQARALAFYELGSIAKKQGNAKRAVNDFERALGIDPKHRPTLDALVELYTALQDWESVCTYQRAILQTLESDDARFALLEEIAGIWNDRAKDAARAAEALEEARALRPNDASVLHRLLARYQAIKDWPKIARTLGALAALEQDGGRRAKLFSTIAQIRADHLGDDAGALEAFDAALDASPAHLEAFERINKILTARRDWRALERAFRKMIARANAEPAPSADLLHTLWHGLGLIYRDRLQEVPSAIEAFKMATRTKPDDAMDRKILAELYESTNDVQGAASEHGRALRSDPSRLDPYKNLCRIALGQKDYDRAFWACAALAVLGKADADERRFLDGYRPRAPLEVKSRLSNEDWSSLLAPKDKDPFIGMILEAIAPAALAAKATQLSTLGGLAPLAGATKHDPTTSKLPVARLFGWGAQVLGMPIPALYAREDWQGALAVVAGSPPATLVGRTALEGRGLVELTFLVGKHLAYWRGEHFVRALFPTLAELKVLFSAAVTIVAPALPVPPELRAAVDTTARELVKYVQPLEKEKLRAVVERYAAEGARADLRRWMQTTEATATRAGLVLCGDLEVARKALADEPQVPGDLSPPEKLKELLVFAVSDEHAALREALGVKIRVAG